MICRLSAFSLMGALAACHPPAPEAVPVPAVAIQAAPVLSVGAGEQYGEYVGPIVASGRAHRITTRCKIEELFCFSEAEWNTIARSYMEE